MHIVLFSFLTIFMLQRTQALGQMIRMMAKMLKEIAAFVFCLVFLLFSFFVLIRLLGRFLRAHDDSAFDVFIGVFNALNSHVNYEDYIYPQGWLVIGIFSLAVGLMLLSILTAIFLYHFHKVWQNIDSDRRKEIIQLKSNLSFDKYYGGVT